MVSYKDLGLVNTREMFAKAIKGGYAIPAFNFNNMEQLQAIIQAAAETKSPVILQVSKGARQYVTVEGELGVLAGVEDEVSSDHHTYTKPEEVVDFTSKTGVDSLAISIGTSHGAYKFTPEQCHVDPKTGRLVPPPLAFDVLDGVMKELPGFPIVLHGSSSVPHEEVDTINKYGGALKAAIGIPEDELRKAAKSAVCKINIDSDSRLAMTAAIRKVFAEKPAEFDPRKYLGPARDNMKKLYIHKIKYVLGSEGKAE